MISFRFKNLSSFVQGWMLLFNMLSPISNLLVSMLHDPPSKSSTPCNISKIWISPRLNVMVMFIGSYIPLLLISIYTLDAFISKQSDNRDFKVFMNCNAEDRPKAEELFKPFKSTGVSRSLCDNVFY